MSLEIRPNAHQRSKATAWAGKDHVADLHREREPRRAKLLRPPPHMATAAELREYAALVLAVAETLETWTS